MTVTYHYISLLSPSWNRPGEKNCQSKVNRLESKADDSLPFPANIRKAWKPTSIHIPLYSTMYTEAQGRFVM